jgi:hypothetical protein
MIMARELDVWLFADHVGTLVLAEAMQLKPAKSKIHSVRDRRFNSVNGNRTSR